MRAMIAPLDFAVLHASNELGAFAGIVDAVPFSARENLSPVPHRAAPVVHEEEISSIVLVNGRVGAAAMRVPKVLIVPVGEQHHEALQPVELGRANEGILFS